MRQNGLYTQSPGWHLPSPSRGCVSTHVILRTRVCTQERVCWLQNILQSGAGSADSAGLEALVIDHGEGDRTLVHHQLGVDTLGWGIGGQLPGSWSCEDSVPCPLVSEAPCQLHPSCLVTHMGIPFLTPCRPTSQVVYLVLRGSMDRSWIGPGRHN